jgi:hypothetical protein
VEIVRRSISKIINAVFIAEKSFISNVKNAEKNILIPMNIVVSVEHHTLNRLEKTPYKYTKYTFILLKHQAMLHLETITSTTTSQ